MEKVTLTGRTKKGKQRVRDFGNTWCVIRREDRVVFKQDAGPWLFVAPPGRDAQDHASRWVHEFIDADFVVMHNDKAHRLP